MLFIGLDELGSDIERARLGVTARKYMAMTRFVGIVGVILMIIVWIILSKSNIIADLSPVVKLGVFVLIIIVCPALFYLFVLHYPGIVAIGRRSNINSNLPHAITYMQALANTLPIYSIFKGVYEAHQLYGEVSRECGYIVRDVEVFGADLVTAIEHTKKTTPSTQFAELLNDLIMIYRSGGSVASFFNEKSDSYQEQARNATESSLQFLEMMAEVYVTVFVAGPIALMIMVISENLSGTTSLSNLLPLVYLGLPLGGIVMIVVLSIVLPSNNMKISKEEIDISSEFSTDMLIKDSQDPSESFNKMIEDKKKENKKNNILKHPMLYYISSYNPSYVVGMVFVVIVVALWITRILPSLFPNPSIYLLVCLIAIAFMIPVAFAEIFKSRYINGIEKQLPYFLSEIAGLKALGMTLVSAIRMIGEYKTGGLTSDLKIVSREVEYGSSLKSALERMENRVGLINVKRSISLLVRASEVTDYVQDVLTIAVADVKNYLKGKRQRFTSSFAYLAIIYLSFGIYLFTAFTLMGNFVDTFQNMGVDIDITSCTASMYIIGIILAIISGLMAGQMASNSVHAGLKHAILLLIATIIVFSFIL